MNAYFTLKQSRSRLHVITQNLEAFDLLQRHNPLKVTGLGGTMTAGPYHMLEFERSDKMITLLRLLGVYGGLDTTLKEKNI